MFNSSANHSNSIMVAGSWLSERITSDGKSRIQRSIDRLFEITTLNARRFQACVYLGIGRDAARIVAGEMIEHAALHFRDRAPGTHHRVFAGAVVREGFRSLPRVP